jgi:hypothetical protein
MKQLVSTHDTCMTVLRFGRGSGKRANLATTAWKPRGARSLKVKKLSYRGGGVWK